MIVCEIKLHSAIDGRTTDLGTLIVCNDGTSGLRARGHYDVRLFKKGDALRVGGVRNLWFKAKAIREARVVNHARLAEPVHSLIAKALKELGYG